ncbi:adenylate/guanylate cyclase family protein [Mycobacterium sp. JS623]|uniref:ATP-binding protein n=1 Tax=Mycobacterium sp. JS623 TaxID=212767 RepID=UPI0002A5895E|nr:adenylate/guanylate cyclase domain-containing protein [Mycobacterium sp. JS623]AGB25700.1 adenylate/guanylate cyclase family protein [Mycobacterium sp. JS623]
MLPATDVCRSCGAAPQQGARYCSTCGSQLTAAVEAAEYKQVTLLFADVVRSMDIAAALDIERLREIMTDLVERSAAVLRHYGGTVEYHGDGVMAIFGAPIALEDHAFRACLAAMAIQEEAGRLAADVARHDGVALQLRVGLNSGRVIAGEIGSGSLGYAATGEQVGMAQRIESVAPPGGVMLSESTAQLVEHIVMMAEPEFVHIKGSDEPIRVRRLLAIDPRDGLMGQPETTLIGRDWELAAVDAILDRAIAGQGAVVNVVGPPGIGKSRVARETAALAASHGAEVFWAFCESHASNISFYAVTRLLRAVAGVADLAGQAARARVRVDAPADADPQDLLLLDDLLGIADPDVTLPQIDPDARRRRLTALINTMVLARSQPALFVIEDAHWIDAVSESMLAELLTIIPNTRSMVLVTTRPEYEGALTRVHGVQTIALAPLGDSEVAALLGELLGADRSVAELSAVIAERAAGNPFFAEEMVRELAQRDVLAGQRGRYVCGVDAAEVSVPATVQAAIEARIDRLSARAKRTLNAASVIGARFEAGLLAALGIDAVIDELLDAELIDQVRFTPTPEYAFRHPLIRAVAYESQLKSDRAQWHRRLADAIQGRAPGAVEENAALIAEHVEAAGDLTAAYGWHMRAGSWSTNRDRDAARVSWERARRIADALPADDPDQLSMRIAPRTMLCATDWQDRAVQDSRGRFAELRELCDAAGDKVSLAIGMTGLATELLYSGRPREGSRVASEQMALLESIGDPTPTMALAFIAFGNWFEVGEFGEILRRSQTIIDLAAGDPAKGAGGGVGSPLAFALAWRGVARYWLGRPEWRQDFHDAVAMARNSTPTTFAAVVAWTYGVAIQYGALRADDSAVCTLEEAVQAAQGARDDVVLSVVEYGLGTGLLSRDAATDRHRGLELIVQARDFWVRKHIGLQTVPIVDLWAGRERARGGDRDAALAVMRQAVDELHQAGRFGYGVFGTGVLVETLLERGTESDIAEAERAIDLLEDQHADEASAIREITLLRLRALLARAAGVAVAFQDLGIRYCDMAKALGYEGHIAWAEAMIKGGAR